MKKRILLVGLDLEPFLGLPDQMAGSEDEWEFVFAASGGEAVDRLAGETFDAAVVDLVLPDMDGARILEGIKKDYPDTLRVVYATPCADPGKMKHWGTEHHLLVKPCTTRILFDLLTRIFTFAQWLPDRTLHGLVSNLQMIPSPPSFYQAVVREIQSPHSSVGSIGQLIATDPSMTAKVLQLANSAAFGLQQQVTDAATAVMYLGAETVRSLVLLAHTFAYFERLKPKDFSIAALWTHLFTTAHYARLIAQEEGLRGEAKAKVFTAGLLHDLGKLVLAVNLPAPFSQATSAAREHKIPLWRVELDLLGTTHAQIGAALLGIWGLPNEIVEAVAWHHQPLRSADQEFYSLTAVHVANVLTHEAGEPADGLPAAEVDGEYLTGLGLTDRVSAWRDACLAGAVA